MVGLMKEFLTKRTESFTNYSCSGIGKVIHIERY